MTRRGMSQPIPFFIENKKQKSANTFYETGSVF